MLYKNKNSITVVILCALFALCHTSHTKSPQERFLERCKAIACEETCQSMLADYEKAKDNTQRFKDIILKLADSSIQKRLSLFFGYSNANVEDDVVELIEEAQELVDKELVDITTTAELQSTVYGTVYGSILDAAVFINSPTFLQWILEHGISPDTTDLYGYPALINAAFTNSDKAVHVLLQAGADVHKKDKKGMTALDYARSRGYKKIETLLAEHIKNNS